MKKMVVATNDSILDKGKKR